MMLGLARRIIFTALLAPASAITAADAQERQAYALHDAFVHRLHSQKTKVDYNLYVGLPRDYDASRKYPVLLVNDGDYAFPIAQTIARHLADRDELPPIIVLGLAYPGAAADLSLFKLGRTRDFTPSFTMKGGYGGEFQLLSGGAARYTAFLASELMPFAEKTYAVAENEWTFVGHSYGGLYGAYLLMVAPGLFEHYLIVSASFWYDNRTLLDESADGLSSLARRERPARIFLAVGARENDPSRGITLVDDLDRFEGHLRALANPKLAITKDVIANESHHTVFPAALTHGLRTIFAPPSG
jgi:predicted alpha/beta superfamily hydrolase